MGELFCLLLSLVLAEISISESARCGGISSGSGSNRYGTFGSAGGFSSGSASGYSVSCNDLQDPKESQLQAYHFYCSSIFSPPSDCVSLACSICEEFIACNVPATYTMFNFCSSDVLLSCSLMPEDPLLADLSSGICDYAAGSCLNSSVSGICSSTLLIESCTSLIGAPYPCDCFMPSATCELCDLLFALCLDSPSCDDLCCFLRSEDGAGYIFLCQILPFGMECPYSQHTCDVCSYINLGECNDLPYYNPSDLCEHDKLVSVCEYPSDDPFILEICPYIIDVCRESDICLFLKDEDGAGYVFLCQTFALNMQCPYSEHTCSVCSYIALDECSNLPNHSLSDICSLDDLVTLCEYPSITSGDEFLSDICPFIRCNCDSGSGIGSGSGNNGISGDIFNFLTSEWGAGYVFLCQMLTFSVECHYSQYTCDLCSYFTSSGCNILATYNFSDLCIAGGLFSVCEYPMITSNDPYFSDICPYINSCYDSGSDSGSGSIDICRFVESEIGIGYTFLCNMIPFGAECQYSDNTCNVCSYIASADCEYIPDYDISDLCELEDIVSLCKYPNVTLHHPYLSDICYCGSMCNSSGSGSASSSCNSSPEDNCLELEVEYNGVVYFCLSYRLPGECSFSSDLCELCDSVHRCPDITLPTTQEVCSDASNLLPCIYTDSVYCSIMLSHCLERGSGVCEPSQLISDCTAIIEECNDSVEDKLSCVVCLGLFEVCMMLPSISTTLPESMNIVQPTAHSASAMETLTTSYFASFLSEPSVTLFSSAELYSTSFSATEPFTVAHFTVKPSTTPEV